MESIKRITLGQVKQIKEKVSLEYTLVNMGTYYVITKNATNECTSYNYHTNYVYLNFCQAIKREYLLLVSEPVTYYNHRKHGLDVANEREDYLVQITNKVIELCCGWKKK